MLHQTVRKFSNITGAAELIQSVIVTFQEDNFRVEIYRDSAPDNATPFHVRIYDQVLEQVDGEEEEENHNHTMIVGMWRELLHVPEIKANTQERCLHEALKLLSEAAQ
jgi:hypothetical protein